MVGISLLLCKGALASGKGYTTPKFLLPNQSAIASAMERKFLFGMMYGLVRPLVHFISLTYTDALVTTMLRLEITSTQALTITCGGLSSEGITPR